MELNSVQGTRIRRFRLVQGGKGLNVGPKTELQSGKVVDLKTRDWVSRATDQDFRMAAEAVVDAALCCREVRDNLLVTEAARNRLIDAVHSDPLVTPCLFRRTKSK